MDEQMKQRMVALGNDPTIHDPEALAELIKGMSGRIMELIKEVAKRDALIVACRALVELHDPDCGLAASMGAILSAMIPQQSTVKSFGVETAQTPAGYMARSVDMASGESILEVGPHADREAAAKACFDATTQKLGIEPSRITDLSGELAQPVQAAMGKPSGTMH